LLCEIHARSSFFFGGGGKSPYKKKHKFGQYNAFILCVVRLNFPPRIVDRNS